MRWPASRAQGRQRQPADTMCWAPILQGIDLKADSLHDEGAVEIMNRLQEYLDIAGGAS